LKIHFCFPENSFSDRITPVPHQRHTSATPAPHQRHTSRRRSSVAAASHQHKKLILWEQIQVKLVHGMLFW